MKYEKLYRLPVRRGSPRLASRPFMVFKFAGTARVLRANLGLSFKD